MSRTAFPGSTQEIDSFEDSIIDEDQEYYDEDQYNNVMS